MLPIGPGKAYQDREELFAAKGLSWMSRQIQHANAAQRVDPYVLEQASIPLINKPGQRLDLLPGVYDQSEY